jgi:hypothetical protein
VDGKATTETSKVNFNGAIARTNYTGNSVDDTTDEGLALNAETQTSERGRLGLDGEFRHDSLTQAVVQPRGTGDVRDTDVGLATSQQVRRTYFVAAPWWSWLLTENSSIRVGYRATDANFSHAAGTGLVDYREDLVTGIFSRQLNPLDDFNVTTNFARFRPETTGNDADTAQLLGGFGRAFSERVRGTISAGVSRTTTDAPGVDTSTGLVTSASLRQTSELSTLEGVIGRDITPSAAGRALRTDQARVFWSYRLSQQTEFIFETVLIRSRTLEGTDPGADRRYYELAPQLRWQWLENVYIVGSYRHRSQKFDALPDSAESNAVFLGLSYGL